MKEKNNIVVERYDERDMDWREQKELREKFPVLKIHFNGYNSLDVFKRNGEIVALRIEDSIIYTHKGIFMRSYANRILEIDVIDWDDNYLYIKVNNGLDRIKRLDISLPIKDEKLINFNKV